MSAPLSATLLPCVACLSLACGPSAVATQDAAPTAPTSAPDAGGAASSRPDATPSASLDSGDGRVSVQDASSGQEAVTPSDDAALGAGESDAAAADPVDAATTGDGGVQYPAPRHWSEAASMPSARSELAVVLLDDRIYVAGGHGGFQAFEAYAPESDSWTRHADLPIAVDHPSLGTVGGRIYLTGADQTLHFAYDPATDAWTERAPLPNARKAAAAVGFAGKLYLFGGTGADATTILRYDPEQDRWEAAGQLDMVLDHLAAVAVDAHIYLLGGRPGVAAPYASVQIYDPADGSLSPGPAMGEGRSGFGAARVGSYVCAAGGEVLEFPFHVLDSAECLDLAAGIWSPVDPMPRALHGVGATGYRGRMYLFGGAEEAASATPRPGAVYVLGP